MTRPVAPPVDPELVANIRKGVVVPWIGAGFSVPLGFPTMRELLQELLKERHLTELGIPIDSSRIPPHLATRHAVYQLSWRELHDQARDFADIASDIRTRMISEDAEHEFFTALRNVLNRIEVKSGNQSSMGHYFLRVLGFRRIVTTNYDRLLERHVAPTASMVTGEDVKSIDYYDRIAEREDVIFKLHGDIGRPDTIPFSKGSFRQLYERPQVRDLVTRLIKQQSLLFIGTSLSNSEAYYAFLERIFREVTAEGRAGRKHLHFAILVKPRPGSGEDGLAKAATDQRDAELRALGIKTIWYETNDKEHSQIYEFLANLASALRVNPVQISSPGHDLRAAYGPEDRPAYLAQQLLHERTASAVTFVTQDLTNAIAPDDYIEIDCIGKLKGSPAYQGFPQAFWDEVARNMLHRRDNLLDRASTGLMSVRALCSRAGLRRSLDDALASATGHDGAPPKDPNALRRLIARYVHTFDLAAKSPALDVRLSDGFFKDAGSSYTPDSYALIVSPYRNGRANLVMAFATQATHGAIQTHLIEANTDLVKERTAHAEEMWWSSTPEIESLTEFNALLEEYKAKAGLPG